MRSQRSAYRFKSDRDYRRYELFCRKLVLERHYTASAFITSCSLDGLKGAYKTPADDLSMERFVKVLVAHVAAFV